MSGNPSPFACVETNPATHLVTRLLALRAALDAVTAVRREGRYNTAEECREIATAALQADEEWEEDGYIHGSVA